jgi:hypothetical protein
MQSQRLRSNPGVGLPTICVVNLSSVCRELLKSAQVSSCSCRTAFSYHKISASITESYVMQLKADVTYLRRQLLAEAGNETASLDIVEMACGLANVGHDVKVRSAEGGGPNCFRNLFHEFLLVKVRVYLLHNDLLLLLL